MPLNNFARPSSIWSSKFRRRKASFTSPPKNFSRLSSGKIFRRWHEKNPKKFSAQARNLLASLAFLKFVLYGHPRGMVNVDWGGFFFANWLDHESCSKTTSGYQDTNSKINSKLTIYSKRLGFPLLFTTQICYTVGQNRAFYLFW